VAEELEQPEENLVVLQPMYKFAIFVDGQLVGINNCDDRMAAIFSSNPVFQEVL
jgi:hypothetical protein